MSKLVNEIKGMVRPRFQRTNYRQVLLGKNRKKAIFLFCAYKCSPNKDPKICDDVSCPLWPFRIGDSEPSPYYTIA